MNFASSYVFRILDMLRHSGDIRDQSLKWSKIDRNLACFGPQIFFGGANPEFLKSIYKIQPDSDHVAKFQGDRSGPGSSENEWRNKKRYITGYISPSGTVVPGVLKTIRPIGLIPVR